MNELIAIVDDEPDILELISLHLKKAGFKVSEYKDGNSFLKNLKIKNFDLVILDLMLPDIDGLEICKQIKGSDKFSSLPVIMLTAKGDESDKIVGLELGADDYVTKPFSVKELAARVKAILRRGNIRAQKEETKKINIGKILTIDLEKHSVTAEGKAIELTLAEFKILSLLSSKKGWVFNRDKILDYLWGQEKIVIDRTIDVHIKNLREKIGKASKFIKNVRGVGYKIEE